MTPTGVPITRRWIVVESSAPDSEGVMCMTLGVRRRRHAAGRGSGARAAKIGVDAEAES